MRTLAMPCLVLVLLVSGCGHDRSSVPRDTVPIACFTMSMNGPEFCSCPYHYWFELDGRCSLDEETPLGTLEFRWDCENDGIWDTEFHRHNYTKSDFKPDPSESVWVARCQVRDEAGNISEAVDSLYLGKFPDPPDLIAGCVGFRTADPPEIRVDTVAVGQEFGVGIDYTCYGDFSDPLFRTHYFRDGVLVHAYSSACNRDLFECGGSGTMGFTIDVAGTYVFRVVLDAENDYIETNEANNEASAELVVVPRSHRRTVR